MEIRNSEVFGFERAMFGCRNPMNSWHLSDSYNYYDNIESFDEITAMENSNREAFVFGEKDLNLAQRLIKAGNEHMKFMRQIQVWADLDMTRFFWSEMDTYSFNSKNSCSTIHKLLNPKNEISKDMFDYYKEDEDIVTMVVNRLNEIRSLFLNAKGDEQRVLKRRAKTLLMEGFLQMRTVNTNYSELRNIVLQRKNHQMKEDWQDCFCKWVTELPYSKYLIFCGMEEEYERLCKL